MAVYTKFYRGRWSLGTNICEVHPHCSSHFQVLPRALVTWYQNSSKDIHTVLVPFASSTEGAGHLVHKFVEGHPHCARPICKFYRGRWTSTLCSSHLQVLPRALVTWYINSSKDIHTVLVPFASSTEDAGHLVPKFVEVHPHSSSHLQVLLRALVTWYQNLSKYIHTPRPICKFYRGRWSLGTKICRSISTLLVPFASSTEGAGHLVPKFVEGHPHCARPICKFYRGCWSLGTKIRRRTSTLCSSHLQVLPRALVTWYQNSSKDIHTVLVPFPTSTEGAGHLVQKFVEVHPHCSSHFQVLPRALVTWYINSSKEIHTVLVPFASSTEGAGHLVHKFVEGHPHCARPICKFYRGRWSLGSKIQVDVHLYCIRPFPSIFKSIHLVA
ncbi:hypothetical protein J6590_061722 [Homalodisca vitripennis]|nr:hypothetical protein J6590_061722 [Homalodisca vitripennis]